MSGRELPLTAAQRLTRLTPCRDCTEDLSGNVDLCPRCRELREIARSLQQPEDALQYGDKIEQKRGDEWVEIGTFARYGQAGQIIGIVDIGGMFAEVTCDPPIRKKPESATEQAQDDAPKQPKQATVNKMPWNEV